MIKLNKRPKPQRLADNDVAWTKILTDKISAGLVPTPAEKARYRHPDIKSELVLETSGKCAYCESKLQHIHHGDVEHIYPKSLDIRETFNWDNLTLACEVCNQNKTNLDPLVEHIIDPYEVDPEDHLFFLGAQIFAKGTVPGRSTRAILKLHRAELVEMRGEHLEKVGGVLEQILDVSLPTAVRQALYDDLCEREGGPAAQYTAMTRCALSELRGRLPADIAT